jgi:hypothetical protein
MSATMIFSKIWVQVTSTPAVLLKLKKSDRLIINHVIIGSNKFTWASSLSLEDVKTTFDKKKQYQELCLFYSQPEIRNPQEILLLWVQYTRKITDKIFYGAANEYELVQLVQHFIVFKTTINVKIVDLNNTKEIVRINFGKVTTKTFNKYIMKFMITSGTNEQSEVSVVSDTAIKSPSHAKITELTEEQYNKMMRDKIFKTA